MAIRRRPDRPKQWEAVYRDPGGRQRTRSFARQIDARRFLATIEADKLRGTYIDPDAGKVTLRTFGEEWLDRQTFDPATREAVASRLRVHVYPTLGEHEIRAIRPSTVQTWLRSRQKMLAPTYVRVLLANLSAMLGAG